MSAASPAPATAPAAGLGGSQLLTTLALAASLLGLNLIGHAAFGGLDQMLGDAATEQGRNALQAFAVISLLLGYTAASAWLAPRRIQRDFESLAQRVPHRQLTLRRFAAEISLADERRAIAVGAVAGILVIPLVSRDFDIYLRASEWDWGLLWSIACNASLFALLARNAVLGRAVERFFEREVTPHVPVDLLDLSPLAIYARRGVGLAMYWLIGSSIASLLFLNYGFSIAQVLILTATLGIGLASLLGPMRGIHLRIREEKVRELGEVRREIRTAREHALHGKVDEASRLPGLLAYEARIEGAATWPFDVSSLLRIGALGALAVGSWVGGALIERGVEWIIG